MPAPFAPVSAPPAVAALSERVRAEFADNPGLQLTDAQACRLFRLDPIVCTSILAALCDLGFLRRDSSGLFRKSELRWSGRLERTNVRPR